MKSKSKYSIGIKYGIITGLVYAVLLFVRYNFFAGSPVVFGLFAIISYILILVLYIFAGIARRKEQGGYANFKEIFQTIFITILVTELVYVLFNFIYLKFVDPSFFDRFQQTTRNLMEKSGISEEKIDKQMESFKDLDKQLAPLGLLKGLGIWIVVDSIFGLIFASILRKKKDIFEDQQTI
jgi:signal transduction histidine kinase